MNKLQYISKGKRNVRRQNVRVENQHLISIKHPFPEVNLQDINISCDLVFAMLGGKWPSGDSQYGQGFNWDAVDHFEIHEGELVPCDTTGEWIPAPNLKMVPCFKLKKQKV